METLQVRRFLAAATDETEAQFAEPHDWIVDGLAPGSMQEPAQANRDLSLIEWTVLARKSAEMPGERDRVIVDGNEFEVDGRPSDFTRGPFDDPNAGVTVELRRAEG